VGALAIFLFAVAVGLNRAAERRRRQAEVLLGAAFQAQDEERRRIVGSLHDDIGQPLYRLLYGIEGSRAKIDPDHPVAAELEQLGLLVRTIDSTLRVELEHLHEGAASDAGLVNAIEDLARVTRNETDLRVVLDLDTEPQGMDVLERTALFRAVQEAVVNTRKHSGARTVRISLRTSGGRIEAAVVDDGVGGAIDRGLGLTTAGERLDALGGGLSVRSRPQKGTVLTAWLPRGAPS
jgi:signal transduction histidine kinase